MESWDIWDVVEGNMAVVRDDKAALGVILRAVPPEVLGMLVVNKTAKDTWDTLKVMWMGVSRVRDVTEQCFRVEFEMITFHDGETLDAFGMRITSLVNQLHMLGDTVEGVRVAVIETLLNLNTVSLEALIGRLGTAEECCGNAMP